MVAVYRFSGTSHITVWLDQIRSSFREAAARAVAANGVRTRRGNPHHNASSQGHL